MANIKLKNANGEDITYENVTTITAPLSNGSGNVDFIEDGGVLPTLHSVTTSISDTTLTITNPATNGDFATSFTIFSGEDELLTTTNSTVDLSALITSAGNYSISCSANGNSFKSSIKSSALTYNVYNVTYNISEHCSLSNTPSLVQSTKTYTATITYDTKYELDTCTITMGGVDITSTSLNGNTITIENLNGAIIITINTKESSFDPSLVIIGESTSYKESIIPTPTEFSGYTPSVTFIYTHKEGNSLTSSGYSDLDSYISNLSIIKDNPYTEDVVTKTESKIIPAGEKAYLSGYTTYTKTPYTYEGYIAYVTSYSGEDLFSWKDRIS